MRNEIKTTGYYHKRRANNPSDSSRAAWLHIHSGGCATLNAELGGLALVNNYSRLVIDPERFEKDEEEIMASKGMGAVYTKTSYQQILRKDFSAEEKEKLLSAYFRPYHKAVALEVQNTLEQFGRCLIIDCHSFPSKPLPYELDQSSDRPDICIGTDPFHTPEELVPEQRGTYSPLKFIRLLMSHF